MSNAKNTIYNYNYLPDNIEHKWVNNSCGIDMSFTLDNTGDIKIVKNEDSIKQNITNLIMLNSFEKLFRPDLACNMRQFLFELFDTPLLKERINQLISQVIALYEPRVRLLKIDYNENKNERLLSITIWYQIIQTLSIDSVEVELEIVR